MKLACVYGRLMSYRLARIEEIHVRDVRFGLKVGQIGPQMAQIKLFFRSQ